MHDRDHSIILWRKQTFFFTMKCAVLVILAVFATHVVEMVPNLYKPSVEQLRIVFPDEYDIIKDKSSRTKISKGTGTSCKNKTCSLEELYEIFGIDPSLLRFKTTTDTNRISFNGNKCPTGLVRLIEKCKTED